MARHVWVLVEWVEENNVLPSYEVVNVDTFLYKEGDLEPGKQIFISLMHNEPRRANVIRISDDKRKVKAHKVFLERQDKQVKNVLQLCMRTINEMKTDKYSSPMASSLQVNMAPGHQYGLPHVITANNDNSSSDSDSEARTHESMFKPHLLNQIHRQNLRSASKTLHKRSSTQGSVVYQSHRSIINSTPILGKNAQEDFKLCFDQGTQTDNAWTQPTTGKLEEIELVLKHLYGRFQSLTMKVNTGTNETMEVTGTDSRGEMSYYVEPNMNESWVISNNANNVEMRDANESNHVSMGNIGAEQIAEVETQNVDMKVPIISDIDRKNLNESTRVRRMSAQTTFSNEMVPIGNGHTMVPARLLNEIDWKSYTTATRQLLQAIFPRKVLATHSLTGKQSPAHLNKPAKKLLDPNLIADIVATVSSRSGVPKNLVRNTITVKCTDEAKLYRNRQRYKYARTKKTHQNDENVPPITSHSSDESSHILP